MLVLGLLSAALGASNVFTLPALVVDGGGIWARSDVCISDGMCLSDAGGGGAGGVSQWKQDSPLDLTPLDAGPIGITVAAVDAGAGTIDATQYCIQGSTCLTSWPASGSQQWLQDSALDYTPIDAGIGITVAAVDAGPIFGVRADLSNQVDTPLLRSYGAVSASNSLLIQGSTNTTPTAASVYLQSAFPSTTATQPLVIVRNGTTAASEIVDFMPNGSTFWDAGAQLTAGEVDAGIGVFGVDVWSPLVLGTFGGFGAVDAGPTVVTTLNATTSSTSPLTLGAFGGFASVDGGFGVFSTLWSALSLGTFGGFGSVDAGPTVVTTLNATTSSTSPLTLGAFAGHAWVDAGAGIVTAILDDTGQVGAPAVDGGFGVFLTQVWSALSLGTFGGFGSVDAGGIALVSNGVEETTASTPLSLYGNPGTSNAIDALDIFATPGAALIDGGGTFVKVQSYTSSTLVDYSLDVNSFGQLTQGGSSTAASKPVPAVYGFDGGAPPAGTIQQPWHWEVGSVHLAAATNAGTLFSKAFTARPNCVVSLAAGTPTIAVPPSQDAGIAGIWIFFSASETANVAYQCVGE